MAVAFIRKSSNTGATSSVSASLTGVAAGSLLVVCANRNGNGTFSCSGGGTWTQAVVSSGSQNSCVIFYMANAAAGNYTVTVSSSGASSMAMNMSEYSGAAATSVLTAASGNVGYGTAITSGNVNGALDGVRVLQCSCTTTAGPTITGQGSWAFTEAVFPSNLRYYEYRRGIATAGLENPTATISSDQDWTTVHAAFAPAPAASSSIPIFRNYYSQQGDC